MSTRSASVPTMIIRSPTSCPDRRAVWRRATKRDITAHGPAILGVGRPFPQAARPIARPTAKSAVRGNERRASRELCLLPPEAQRLLPFGEEGVIDRVSSDGARPRLAPPIDSSHLLAPANARRF